MNYITYNKYVFILLCTALSLLFAVRLVETSAVETGGSTFGTGVGPILKLKH